MSSQALILPPPSGFAEFRRWGIAAAIVCAAHVGLMAAYLLRPTPEPEGSNASPAVLIDLAPIPVAPSSDNDLAPGPEMVEAQPTPKPPPQLEPEVVDPVPMPEAQAEVMLPKPEPKAVEKKPEEKPDTQKTEVKEIQPDNTPAPRTTSAPRSEQRTAAVPQAPSPGSAASQAAMASWRDLLLARLQQNKRYPAGAESRREQGVVTLAFTVDRHGRVLSRHITRSSGVADLDGEVLAMIERAQPLPAFPPSMTQGSVNLVVPIRFSLR